MTHDVGRINFEQVVTRGKSQGRLVHRLVARRLLSLSIALGLFVLSFQYGPVYAQAHPETPKADDTVLYLPAITGGGIAAQHVEPEESHGQGEVVSEPQPEEVIPAPEPDEIGSAPEPDEIVLEPEPTEIAPEPEPDGVGSEPVNSVYAATLWQADMETGDLSQWHINNDRSVESDSGLCSRPGNGVSTERAHSGLYSMKMVINSAISSGCRQFRKPEPATGEPLYYSAWYYSPEQVRVRGNWNLFQFKSKTFEFSDDGDSGVFWKLEVRNNQHGEMALILSWKGPIEGPRASDGIKVRQYYQTVATLPVREWVHIEVYLRQSEAFDGQIIVWQDGVEIFDMDNVRTRFPGGDQIWSVNNYGKGLQPNPTTLYIDDAAISTERVGP